MNIPHVDLRSDGSASQIDTALRDFGFMTISGHGVPPEVIAAAWDVSGEFFDLPLEYKLSVASDDPNYPYGYSPIADEALAEDAAGDPKESFNIAPPFRSGVEVAGGFKTGSRIWPDRPSTFQSAWEAYYSAMERLCSELMSLFAEGLELSPSFFDDKIDRHLSAMRALNYPAGGPAITRAGAHSDYGSVTVLLPDPDVPGLEVQTLDQDWSPVSAPAGTFVVNIGDLMALWTNDRWRSTVHRVVPDVLGRRRRSIAFFHQPNWDALIEPLPTCVNEQHPSRYAPTKSGPWLQQRVAAAHDLNS